MPISELFSKWKTYYEKKGTNYFLLNNKISLSYNNIGIYHSFFLYGKTNKDSAYLLYVLNSKNNINKGDYNVDIYLKGYETKGVFLFKDLKNFAIRFNIFKVINHQNGYLKGNVTAYDNNKYDFQGYSDYYFSKNYLYHWWGYKKSYGYGASFDLYLKKKINSLKINLNIEDIGRMYINNSPHTKVYINSSNKTKKNGYVTYNPIISGKETYEKLTMNSVIKYTISLNYKHSIFAFKKIKNIKMPYIGVTDKNYKFLYNFKFKTIGINYKYKNLYLAYFANKLNPNKASSLGFNINFLYNF